MLNKEKISILNNLINHLEKLGKDLEYYYLRKDIENYERIKNDIIKISSEISKVIE